MTEDPRIDPADLRNVRFPGSSRRYDARSVDQFLETVATRIAATNELVDELRARILDLEATPAAPAATPPPQLAHLDDDELVRLVGEETTSGLSTARRAADEIRSKAEESAARMVREATTEADRAKEEARATAATLTREAEEALEQATTAATAEASRITDAAAAEAEQTLAQATELAEAELAAAEARRAEADSEVERILEEAREEGRGMVAEAKEVRTRILDDLQRRRDTARDQIERLLAGRERLLAAYDLVRENLDDITGQLADALPDPGEPELPDGFVGIVGTTATDHDEDEERAAADHAAAVLDEVDDTVAPVSDDDTAAYDDAEGTVEDPLAPVADDVVLDAADRIDGPGDGAGADDPVAETESEADSLPEEGSAEDAGDAAPHAEDDLGPVPEEELGTPDDAVEDVAAEDDGSQEVEQSAPDEPVTELDADEAEEHAPGGGHVDALFARLRAEREQSVAKAREVVQGDDATADDAPPESDEAQPTVAGESEGDVPEGAPAEGRGDVDRIPSEFLADDDALAARREALAPLDTALNRALKRKLADEQNELLDLLRRSGTTTATDLLPELAVQAGSYAKVAEKHLRAAAVAGGGDGVDVDLAPLAEALGAALVEPFRRRVERSSSEVGGDADELDERLRALYREWKVQHIAPVAQDALLSAYALGTLRAAEPDGRVRWLIDPAQGPCPDAQDNALAGEVTAGEAFPTGDACPQAHPGCHCLLTRS